VLLVARDREQLDQVRNQIVDAGGAASVFPCDLMNASAVAQLGEAVAKNHERCDILVNNVANGMGHQTGARRQLFDSVLVFLEWSHSLGSGFLY
jgi:short-subunit dehydrogenase